MERIVFTCLQWYIEASHYLPENFIGFRKKSFSSSWSQNSLLSCTKLLLRNKSVYAVFLDVELAYPTTNVAHVIIILQQLEVPHHFLLIIWKL